jgi:hypothetical protein
MNWIDWLIVGWAGCAVVVAAIAVAEIRKAGEVKLGFLLASIGLVALGPMSLVGVLSVLIEEHRDTVVWRSKKPSRR